MYLKSFTLPCELDEDFENPIIRAGMINNGGYALGYIDNSYPCGIFPPKQLSSISFSKITILYGGNGSGKSTLLNLIANKLELIRLAPYNASELFDMFTHECSYENGYDDEGFRLRIPNGSRIVTSDDVFDYMLTARSNNEEVASEAGEVKEEWASIKYGKTVKMTGMEDYEALRTQLLARRKSVSRRQFIKKSVGSETKLLSNGETAFEYFDTKLKSDTLYCLDEPENSLSPKLQIRLAELISELAHYCGCQFIIATHSPFLLALEGARIYDLDTTPVLIKNWWELENTKTYFEFFKKHRGLFK